MLHFAVGANQGHAEATKCQALRIRIFPLSLQYELLGVHIEASKQELLRGCLEGPTLDADLEVCTGHSRLLNLFTRSQILASWHILNNHVLEPHPHRLSRLLLDRGQNNVV